VERGLVVRVARVHVRPGLEQRARHGDLALLRRDVERRGPLLAAREARARPPFEEEAGGGEVA
jgi:hypothetical protein